MLVSIEVCGDHWINQHSVLDLLKQSASTDKKIMLDFNSEGPSFNLLGLTELINSYGIDPDRVCILRFPNTLELLPYRRVDLHIKSHFWSMSKQYSNDELLPWTKENKFSLFLGRRSIARCAIMYDMYHEFGSSTLLSLMEDQNQLPWDNDTTSGVNYESADQFITDTIATWWENVPVTSIDNKAVNHQYIKDATTNRDLLQFYNQFAVELVCETCTLGETFFVTEKTVRPIAACKPMIVYGPKNYLANLRKLGFKTWGSLWDEDYDNYSGIDRWQLIKTQLHYLQNMTDIDFATANEAAVEICLYNKKVLDRLIGTL